VLSRRDSQFLKPVLGIIKNVHQGQVLSSEGCEVLNAEVSRREYNVHWARSFHIRPHISAEGVQTFAVSRWNRVPNKGSMLKRGST